MKLGFLTVCMADRSLEQIAQWAADQGFSSLELAAWSQTADGAGVDHLGLQQDDAAIVERVGATLAAAVLVVLKSWRTGGDPTSLSAALSATLHPASTADWIQLAGIVVMSVFAGLLGSAAAAVRTARS